MAILIRIGVDGDNLTGVRLECGAHLGRLLRVGELVGDEFDHEAPALADLSHARVLDDCAIGVGRRRPAPELTISVRDRPALLDPALRTPLRDDVVVVFGIGGNFEQHDLAVSPIADRFDPERGPELPVRVVVAERFEIAVAMQQSETARILVAEGGDLQRFAIGDGAPYPFSRAVQDLQTGHVIDVLAHVVAAAVIEAAEHIHARHRTEPDMVDRYTREQRQFGVDDGGVPGVQGEAEGASQAGGIEQRVDDERVGGGARLLDPERAKQWKFLALRIARANRKAARADAIELSSREAAKERRALKNRRILPTLAAAPAENADAGKTEVAKVGGELQLTEIIKIAIVEHALRLAALDQIELHRRRENETAVERFEREPAMDVAPDRRTRNSPDRRVLFERQVVERVRQGRTRRLERRLGESTRHVQHVLGAQGGGRAEGFGVGARGVQDSARRCERAGDREFQKFPTRGFCHDARLSRVTSPPRALAAATRRSWNRPNINRLTESTGGGGAGSGSPPHSISYSGAWPTPRRTKRIFSPGL